MAGDRLRLIYVDGSPFARVVRVLIREWALDVSTEEVAFPLPPEIDGLTPLGQVPLLVGGDDPPFFPTLNIIEHLARSAHADAPFAYSDGARRPLVVALAAGDGLAQSLYQTWAGLGAAGKNHLGFDPGQRNMERFRRTLRWLTKDPDTDDLIWLIAAVFVDWTRSRGVEAPELTDEAAERISAILARDSLSATAPRPYDVGS